MLRIMGTCRARQVVPYVTRHGLRRRATIERVQRRQTLDRGSAECGEKTQIGRSLRRDPDGYNGVCTSRRLPNCMVEQEEQLPTICSVKDIEGTVFTRVVTEVAEMERQGHIPTSEDVERLWREKLQKVREQMEARVQKRREQVQIYLPRISSDQ